jgi:hypothetical protein
MSYQFTWLRPFEEDLSKSLGPIQGLSNLGPLWLAFSPILPLDLGLPCHLVPCGLDMKIVFCGRYSGLLIIFQANRNLFVFTTLATHGLLTSLSSSKLYLLLYTPFSTFGPQVLPSDQYPCLPALQQHWVDHGLVNVKFYRT